MQRFIPDFIIERILRPLRALGSLVLLLLLIGRAHADSPPYINTWLILGTFSNDTSNSGYNTSYITESSTTPQNGATEGGRTWRYFDDRLFSRNFDNYNDLYSYYRIRQSPAVPVDGKVVYAHTYVYSPTTQSNIELWIGADIGFKAWVNGSYVMGNSNIATSSLITSGAVEKNGGRDLTSVGSITLNAGWNRLLLKLTNTGEGRFGFYARFKKPGNLDPGLTYSTGGGSGSLAIATSTMPESGNSNLLPTAFREWSYVGAQPDVTLLRQMGNATSGPGGQKPPAIPGMMGLFTYNEGLGMQASPFKFNAKGGTAPYTWSKTSGSLPTGITLSSDGTLSGTAASTAALGNYSFTVKVTDATSANTSVSYTLTLAERPNRWIEKDRLIALMHGPENVAVGDVPTLCSQMAREGYKVGIPVSYNNGDFLYRWPTSYGTNETSTDVVQLYKTALNNAGLKFGMYMGNLSDPSSEYPINKQISMVEEAMRLYQPKVLWCDWLGQDGTSLDGLFSMVKTISPDTLILLNGSERMSNGDWDVITFEGWNAWGSKTWATWPTQFPWPKKGASASWRLSVDANFGPSGGNVSSWSEMLRVQLSLIGEGNIADIDHSAAIGSIPTGAFSTWPLVAQHESMANWASPSGKPPLYEAYTQVDRGPLPNASYGYNTINIARDKIYLLALQNPRGKTGLPAGGSLTVGPVNGTVTGVTWMNNNSALSYTTTAVTGGYNITINTSSVTTDPVASIIKLTLASPLSEADATPPALPTLVEGTPGASQVPYGNIATGCPAWLMTADNSTELIPSSGDFAVFGVDGNPNTQAVGANAWAWSYKVDLGRSAAINKIVAMFGQNTWATEFNILVSNDNTNWQTVVHSTSGVPGTNAFNITPVWGRYVRVQAVSPNAPGQTGTQMGISELQVFESNLALGKPSYLRDPGDTTTLPPSGPSVAAYGVDGNLNTIAQGANSWAWSYKIDLGRVATLSRISVVFHPNGWATAFKIHVSQNGTSWTTVVNSTSGLPGVNAFNITPVDARYVRVEAVSPNAAGQTGVQMAVAELEANGMYKGNVALGKSTQLLSADGTRTIGVSGSQYASNGVDGNLATTAAGNEWAWTYQVDLGSVMNVSRLVANFHSGGWATAFKIHVSQNGTSWTTVVNSTSGTSGANAFDIAPANARYVRLEAVTPNGPSQTGVQMTVTEFEVYQ